MKSLPATRTALRCGCPTKHLLGFYGVTKEGELYLHVKSHRGGKPLSNVVMYGDCDIQCPACSRWHVLHFREDGGVDKTETLEPPAEIAEMETLARTNNAQIG